MSHKNESIERSPLSPIQTLVCGFAGIALPKTILAPIDTLKLFSQIYGSPNVKEKVINQVKLEGFPSLFNGIFCDWIRIPLQSITHYTLFNHFRQIHSLNSAVADTIAATAAATLFHPLDVIQSLMISNPIKYQTIPSTTAALLKQDGFFGLYRGITPTLVGHIPHRSVQLVTHLYLKKYPLKKDFLSEFLFTAGAIGVSRAVTYPFDTIRKRMICDETVKGKSMIEVMKITHETRGFSGFYNGFGISLVKTFPMIYLQEKLTHEFRNFIGRFNYLMERHNFKKKSTIKPTSCPKN